MYFIFYSLIKFLFQKKKLLHVSVNSLFYKKVIKIIYHCNTYAYVYTLGDDD